MEKELPIKNTYLKEWLKTLGLTEKDVTVKFKIPKGSTRYQKHQKEGQTDFSFFTGDQYDNLVIHYYRPQQAKRYDFKKPGNKWPELFIRTRLKKPLVNPVTGKITKYLSPKESGLNPFFTPQLINAYINDQKIDTLVITEGEKKAFKASLDGIPTIGLTGYEGFYSTYDKGQMHEDILDFITVCKVKNVIFLTDADTLTVKYTKEGNLKQRPLNFFNAVKSFYSVLEKTVENPNTELKKIYYSHIRTKFVEDGKGIDDLLVKFKGKEDDVRNDLFEFEFASRYFIGFDITDGKTNKLFGHFGLSNETEFYNTYKDFIGSKPFRFGKRVYEWNGEEVKYLQHEDTEKYCRIGPNWYKEVELTNKHGIKELELKKWAVGEIQRDYKKYPDFLDNIPKYDGFCSEPDFSQEYKREHNNLRNVYDPCMHQLTEGSFETTKKFLKHIFGGQSDFDNLIEGDTFTVALDYLTLQFQNPKQMLPVPQLVSKEFGTGKSTFIKWIQAVYVGNTVLLNNEMFKMSFNSHYITKYVICIDEGFMDVDKKSEKERLKQLVTADTAFLQYKGVDVNQFIYYGKIIMCSNDENSLMKMEDGEDRWFVIKVPVPKEKDPDLEKKLNAEIPAWLNFLSKREVFHKKTDRFWFKKEHIITDQYKLIVQGTKSHSQKTLETFIVEHFLMYTQEQMKMSADFILERVNRNSKYRIDHNDLRKILEETKGLKKMERHRYQVPVGLNEGIDTVIYERKNDRPYLFQANFWLNETELGEMNRNKTLEPHEVKE